ncbi:MAG: DUF3147 family protein [Candidatus Methanospirareceae archaeon]
MTCLELLLRFLLGGAIVLIATLIADIMKNSVISGIAATFPGIIISVAIALFLAGYPPDFISNYFLGTLTGIVILIPFSLSSYYFVREYGFLLGLLLSLLIWLLLAFSFAFVRASVFNG